MIVSELIDQLKKLPQGASVRMVYDGASRDSIDLAYLANDESVNLIAEYGYVYELEDCPIGNDGTAPVNEWVLWLNERGA